MTPKIKADLAKVGLDGLSVLDSVFRPKGKSGGPQTPQQQAQLCLYQYQPQAAYSRQVISTAPVCATREVTMDCYEVAKNYGGAVIKDYPMMQMIHMS